MNFISNEKSFFKNLIFEKMHDIDFYADKRINVALTERKSKSKLPSLNNNIKQN